MLIHLCIFHSPYFLTILVPFSCPPSQYTSVTAATRMPALPDKSDYSWCSFVHYVMLQCHVAYAVSDMFITIVSLFVFTLKHPKVGQHSGISVWLFVRSVCHRLYVWNACWWRLWWLSICPSRWGNKVTVLWCSYACKTERRAKNMLISSFNWHYNMGVVIIRRI